MERREVGAPGIQLAVRPVDGVEQLAVAFAGRADDELCREALCRAAALGARRISSAAQASRPHMRDANSLSGARSFSRA
jgi:hypothetical protein